MVLGEPDRAVGAADLLVDDRRRRAGRRAPGASPRGRASDAGGDLRGGLRLHVERAAAPQLAVDRRRRTTGRARHSSGVGEHGVDVREQARASGRRRCRAGARRGSGAPSVRPTSVTSNPASRSRSPASSSCAARSLPGGLTVLMADQPREQRPSPPACRSVHRPIAILRPALVAPCPAAWRDRSAGRGRAGVGPARRGRLRRAAGARRAAARAVRRAPRVDRRAASSRTRTRPAQLLPGPASTQLAIYCAQPRRRGAGARWPAAWRSSCPGSC